MKILYKGFNNSYIAQGILFVGACLQQHWEVLPGKIWVWLIGKGGEQLNWEQWYEQADVRKYYLWRLGVAILFVFYNQGSSKYSRHCFRRNEGSRWLETQDSLLSYFSTPLFFFFLLVQSPLTHIDDVVKLSYNKHFLNEKKGRASEVTEVPLILEVEEVCGEAWGESKQRVKVKSQEGKARK